MSTRVIGGIARGVGELIGKGSGLAMKGAGALGGLLGKGLGSLFGRGPGEGGGTPRDFGPDYNEAEKK